MEHVSSVRPTGKFPEKVENLKRWSHFPGWNFRTECRVPLTFLVVCTSSRSTVGHPATYRGLRPNGTTFYQSGIPLLLPPKFPVFSLHFWVKSKLMQNVRWHVHTLLLMDKGNVASENNKLLLHGNIKKTNILKNFMFSTGSGVPYLFE